MNAKLILSDKTVFEGEAQGYQKSSSGEVVFTTGMVGYDLSLTDPSYAGQILTFTYPLIGNWGVPKKEKWESEKIHLAGVIISDLTEKPSHHQSIQNLNSWLIENKIPAIVGIDTRALTQKLRDKGVMLGKIITGGKDVRQKDPNQRNLVAEVSITSPKVHKSQNSKKGSPNIVLLNCGAKKNIVNCLTSRGATVFEIPWDFDPFDNKLAIDGLVISNGPGNPKMAQKSIDIIRKSLDKKIPTFGICLGNQLLALAAGGDTYKLKFGHRAQNQPTIQVGTRRCYITTQNHGYAVNEKKLPAGFKPWFTNANDNTNEGIIHKNLPFFSVQFHPEAAPGPTDTEFLFDFFLDKVKTNQ
jgi:carbamoyl-phosphate synthase small subunit